jgi:hypothetical protein
MKIIGCDLHARQQTIAMLDSDTGELEEKTLEHQGETVREFYSALTGGPLFAVFAKGGMGLTCCRSRKNLRKENFRFEISDQRPRERRRQDALHTSGQAGGTKFKDSRIGARLGETAAERYGTSLESFYVTAALPLSG